MEASDFAAMRKYKPQSSEKKEVLNLHFSPKKSLGQNFLIDKNIALKIIQAANLRSSDNVLEVGPGRGALTLAIARRVKRLVAVEKDKKLAENLNHHPPLTTQEQNIVRSEGLKVINADILKLDFEELRKGFGGEPYKIVANLPYNITSRFLRIFLEAEYRPTEMILMVQREVAERIAAEPGQMSLLSVSVQFYSEPKILFRVAPECFFPRPKVESAVIKLHSRAAGRAVGTGHCPVPTIRGNRPRIVLVGHCPTNTARPAEKHFFELVRRGFGARRKKLLNNLSSILPRAELEKIFASLGFSPTVRPQELGVKDWVNLYERVSAALLLFRAT